ncbi:efflux transporter, RND family, MFP subunit [Chthoniobacter flavus Ellin428]|uniref:Efflux transporter, RND family, MFP subunit n=1 Tax=Chthoniobacter flavus Ellin428 TaxID=497964 RepID=B4D1F7_9BACT|nr:efflux RND transporter periplasmic adaptor subunit [Chthoniobacter flavus]EDY19569.1 efflux transporter, RND family, MFP subunit [Chthoniobacter flavus Ellin428]TCO92812.1 membrane fusion protein (multidrug efflux system) [Chthoniobacter flavus]
MKPILFRIVSAASLAAIAALLLTSCGRKEGAAAGGPGGPGGPQGPLEVGVLTVTPSPVTLTQDLPGRISAYRVAEVRARVNGIVLRRHFTEGSDVKEGQVLYDIDPAPYQAALDSAQATLARAEANVATARLKEERYKQLLATKTIARQDYDDALANARSFDADVLAGRAAVQTAKINLEYTKVTAPISGRIGISQVTEGAYVQTSAANLLAVIQQLDPVYLDVTQASSEFLRLKRDLAEGRLKADEKGKAQVKLIHETGDIYAEEGALEMADVTVNATTNSVTIRAVFPNPRGELLPGLFVRERLEEGNAPNAILVPQLAVTRNTKGQPTAMVVGANGTAELRVLETPRAVGNQWLVASGLKAGDQVIVNNLQRVRPGAPVKAIPAPPEAVTASITR